MMMKKIATVSSLGSLECEFPIFYILLSVGDLLELYEKLLFFLKTI